MLKKLQQHIFHYRIKYGLPLLRKINRLRGKKRILLYTDSRGKNIGQQFHYIHYSEKLSRKYSVEAVLVPHKWTTIIDFISEYKASAHYQNDFDLIILHTGIVDFAPRPISSLRETIYPQKKEKFDNLFGEARIKEHLSQDLGVEYYGEMTGNMYSKEMAKDVIIPELLKIPNLLWISGNQSKSTWVGNYWKERPKNMYVLDEYVHLFEERLPQVLSFMDWTEEEIKKNTFDVIHPNKKGSNLIYNKLEKKLKEIFQ